MAPLSSPSLPYFPVFTSILLLVFFPTPILSACNNTCGSLPVLYPFGTGYGCGSPRFHPSVTCGGGDDGGERLVLTTHAGTYPITSIDYAASNLVVTPPLMSTCSAMFPSAPNFALDWPGPFQLGPSLFVLLSCPPPTSSLAAPGGGGAVPLCDAAETPRLCASLHTCPAVASLGLPIYAPTNTCCAYSPAGLGPKGELDLRRLRCAAYASVVSYGGGDAATEPLRWEYGVALKYGQTGLGEEYGAAETCASCQRSGGVCGYAPPRDYFVCVCRSGVNTSTDCVGQERAAKDYWTSVSGNSPVPLSQGRVWFVSFAVLFFLGGRLK